MTDSIIERIQRLRKDTLEIAKDSLDYDLRAYRVLSDVAVRLTDIIKQNSTTESVTAVSQPNPIAYEPSKTIMHERVSPGTIGIKAKYKGVTYQALLDPSRINSGLEECIYFEGDWRTASGSAMRVATSNVNGWNFWRYKRDDGSEGRLSEIRSR